jgi:hypothetical protein
MSEIEPLAVVRSYTEAFRARDLDRMLALVDESCEFASPRGVLRGHEPLRAFVERQTYGVTMVPIQERYFARGDTVVASGVVEWRHVDSGEVADREDGAIVFTVHDGRITRFTPQDDLATALSTAGLTSDDEHGLD